MLNIAEIISQTKDIQKKIAEAKEQLHNKEYEGESGLGAVKIWIKGTGVISKVYIDQSLILERDQLTIQDLVKAAFNNAKQKLDQDSMDQLSSSSLPPSMQEILKLMK